MDTGVMEIDEISLDLQLLSEIGLKLPVKVIYDGLAAVVLVELVSKTSSAHHGQPQTNIALLQIIGVLVKADFGLLVGHWWIVKAGLEERVYQCGLANARLPDAENVEIKALIDTFVDQLVWQAVKTNVSRQTKVTPLRTLLDRQLIDMTHRSSTLQLRHISNEDQACKLSEFLTYTVAVAVAFETQLHFLIS